MGFVSSIYKENVDTLLYGGLSKGSTEELIRLAEKVAVARLCNTLYNLPEVLAGLEKEFAAQSKQKQKFVAAQESGGVVKEFKKKAED